LTKSGQAEVEAHEPEPAAVSPETGCAMWWVAWVYSGGSALRYPDAANSGLGLTLLFTFGFFNAGLHRAIQRAVMRLD
jgi:hypothetical protein